MRISSIDIGTNTVLLLIADVGSDGTVTPIAHGHEIVRLGKGLEQTGRISEESIDRFRNVLRHYLQLSRNHGADRIVACGTSAVREAQNREEFRDLVKREFGIDVVILSGKEEADLTYIGAISEFSGDEHCTVIDIGGGSTELTTGTKDGIHASASLPLGCVRLTERFLTGFPPSQKALESVREVVDRELEHLSGFSDRSRLVGVAGTVTTLAAMDLRLQEYDPHRVSGHRLSFGQVDEVCTLLAGKTIEEIRRIPQIHPARADILLAGIMILRSVMQRFGWKELTVSERGLRYGFAMKSLTRSM